MDDYGQFCPVALTAEILTRRWTPLVIRELLCGSVRFNELRRGVPRMSPSLLSTRLDELELKDDHLDADLLMWDLRRRTFPDWLGLSMFAGVERPVVA